MGIASSRIYKCLASFLLEGCFAATRTRICGWLWRFGQNVLLLPQEIHCLPNGRQHSLVGQTQNRPFFGGRPFCERRNFFSRSLVIKNSGKRFQARYQKRLAQKAEYSTLYRVSSFGQSWWNILLVWHNLSRARSVVDTSRHGDTFYLFFYDNSLVPSLTWKDTPKDRKAVNQSTTTHTTKKDTPR